MCGTGHIDFAFEVNFPVTRHNIRGVCVQINASFKLEIFTEACPEYLYLCYCVFEEGRQYI